jgi:hypothetical protein
VVRAGTWYSVWCRFCNRTTQQRRTLSSARMHAVDCGLWTVDCGLWTVDCGLWTVDCGLWTVDCGLWTVDCGLPVSVPVVCS